MPQNSKTTIRTVRSLTRLLEYLSAEVVMAGIQPKMESCGVYGSGQGCSQGLNGPNARNARDAKSLESIFEQVFIFAIPALSLSKRL
jgi:hypothetical protein